MTKEESKRRHAELHDTAARALVELMWQDYGRVEYERRSGGYCQGATPTQLARQAAAYAYALVLAVAEYEERS